MPSLQKFRSALDSELIGKIFSVRCEVGQFLPSWRPDKDYRNSVSAQSNLGGGVLLELSHEFDYLRWIFGEVEWVQAVLRKQSDLDIDVEDTAHLNLGFNAKFGRDQQLIASVNLDFLRHDKTRLCTAIGDKGSLRWNGLTGVVEQFTIEGGDWLEIFCDGDIDSYEFEWAHFLNCVSGYENLL